MSVIQYRAQILVRTMKLINVGIGHSLCNYPTYHYNGNNGKHFLCIVVDYCVMFWKHIKIDKKNNFAENIIIRIWEI